MSTSLNASGILYDRQYGFRKKHTTTQAILDLVNNLYDNISKNKLSSLVAIDLTKAFDTVNHKILLEKLDYYEIRGKCNALVRSYRIYQTEHKKCQSNLEYHKALFKRPLFFIIPVYIYQ